RYSGWHLMGTAKMGDDPAKSVVNRFQRSHDVENLYIVDGSVFVTSSGVNPTATITALALRTADNIVKSRSLQAVPS
ncbi:MAG TPA: GMC family oxidoreductase, partial [Acidimicrobiaceae bacterium]|nr:GMC family oxidoreductase [Acidimicrobiaceae bacterium]